MLRNEMKEIYRVCSNISDKYRECLSKNVEDSEARLRCYHVCKCIA